MAKFGINDILNAKTKAAGQQAQGYKEIYLSPYEVKAAEENTHQKLEGIEELADSFLHVGQEQPTVLARLAHGGVLQNGAAMVAEAGPELIQMVNGQTIVTPLTPTARNTAMDTVNGKQGGSTTNEIQLKIENFYNNREQDIRELTEEILEIADQIKEREEAAYA
ncbi:hypothetical protein POG09_15315 [Coprococcus comes]|uniref:hypothetical protein n=1 Tax=Coprococcus comes TaxID=410072 RepID=UPI001FAB6887|nr:hypothetical protein [Coprococcus comes]MDC0787230.1 hypothetical protein [Coprococcus comes]MDC0790510.1 hypothetical protein [Coprococcus comes]MDC0793805.1 hypothetical protein [Coprococcus comes]MDC0797017.1 hypothetical protein [Coprococcus comes]